MIPLTPAAEIRDNPEWVEEMLQQFDASCQADKNCGPQVRLYLGPYLGPYLGTYLGTYLGPYLGPYLGLTWAPT